MGFSRARRLSDLARPQSPLSPDDVRRLLGDPSAAAPDGGVHHLPEPRRRRLFERPAIRSLRAVRCDSVDAVLTRAHDFVREPRRQPALDRQGLFSRDCSYRWPRRAPMSSTSSRRSSCSPRCSPCTGSPPRRRWCSRRSSPSGPLSLPLRSARGCPPSTCVTATCSIVLPFVVQLWLLATPIAYPSSRVPARWQALIGLNPVAGVVEGFRWSVTGHFQPRLATLLLSALTTSVVLVGGVLYFRNTERTFADVI